MGNTREKWEQGQSLWSLWGLAPQFWGWSRGEDSGDTAEEKGVGLGVKEV